MNRTTGLRAVIRALVLRPLIREPGRSLLTISGIAVGVAVLVAIQLSNQSALQAFDESVNAVAGRANQQIISASGSLDESLLYVLQPWWSSGLRFAPVIDLDGSIVPSGTPVRILGVDLLSDLHFRDYRYARILTTEASREQRFQTFLALFQSDSAIVPETFAAEHHLALGDPIRINSNGRSPRFIVRGILKARGPATAFNGSLVILDIATAQRALGMRGKLTRVDLMVPAEALPRLSVALGDRFPSGVRMEPPSRRGERVGTMLRAFRVNLLALAAVSLLVGIFLVYNTVLVSVLRRRGQIGILKTLGVSPRQIFAAFLLEGTVLGLAGSALGLVLGYGLAWSTLGLIARTVNSLYVTTAPRSISLTVGIAASGLVTGMVIAILSALQPAAEAARVRPAIAIREGRFERLSRRRMLRLAAFAAVCFVIGAALSQVRPLFELPLAGYLSVLFVVAGFSLLAPMGLQAVARLLSHGFRRGFGVAGTLASASFPSSLRRTAIATAALTIAIGMMVAVSLMIGSFRETVNLWIGQTVRSDLWIRPSRSLSNGGASTFPPEILEALNRMSFIDAVDPFRGRNVLYRDRSIFIGSSRMTTIASHGGLPMISPRDSRRALAEAIRRNGVVVSEAFALRFDVEVGEVIQLPTASGVTAFPVTGIYRDYSTDRGVVVMNRPLFERSFGDSAINTIAIYLRPGIDPEVARREIERQFGSRFHAFAFSNRTIRSEVMKIFDQTFMITYALLVVSLAIAVLGIVNTLAALILERRREVALLRLAGLLGRQVRIMIVLESLVIGITSTGLGAACGEVLALILIYVINRQSFGWTIDFHPPWPILILSVGVTFAATVGSGFLSSRLADRVRLAAELQEE